MILWDEKRYHSLNYEFKKRFQTKVYKLAIDGGFTCPNRDGTLDSRGCIFCSQGGSGDFAASRNLTINQQIEQGKELLKKKRTGGHFIAYFQAYTNTYAPLDILTEKFTAAIRHPEVTALSIATRPDCLPGEVLGLLSRLNQLKPVYVELGLQTIHESTAARIRRGYPLECFEKALVSLRQHGLETVVHVILGLPGETGENMLETARYLSHMPVQGIKFQLLHVLKNTDLASLYEQCPFHILTLEEYTDLVIRCIELLPPEMVIHRITGDGPKSLLIEPLWSGNKKHVLNTINHQFKIRNTWQGRCYEEQEV